MNMIDVTPIEIRDYAISYGWTLVKDAINEGLFVLNSPNMDYKQLMFPIEPSNPNFKDLAELSISKLAASHNQTAFQVIEAIRDVNEDVLSLRYYSEHKAVNSISFQEALGSIEATKQMLLAAGCSIVNPVLYHKRLGRTEALEFLKKTRFRHTQEGSFILKVSCPIQLEAPLLSETLLNDSAKPMSRKAFELINMSAIKVLHAIERDDFDALWEEQAHAEQPILSYNFCDSLVSLFDDERELPFELKFNWSRAYMHKLPLLSSHSVVRFPYSFKSKIEELKGYFKPESKDTVDTFFGTVESLNGNEGEDGRRLGEVVMALIIEGELVQARINLTADLYEIAYKAHGQRGSLIRVKGRLQPGKRIRTLDEVLLFESVL